MIRSVSFETSAQRFEKIVGKLLTKSSPPKAVTSPKRTAICINIFLLLGIAIDNAEKIIIGIPKKAGISEVIELLPEKNETNKANITKKTPYSRENLVNGRFKTLNSLIFSLN